MPELGGLTRGTVLVQASQTIATDWLPRHLVPFCRARPGSDIRLEVGNEHPWAGGCAIEPAHLVESEWVLREAGSSTCSVFEAALVGFGIAPSSLRVVLDLPSDERVRAAFEAAMGATAISASVAVSSIEASLLNGSPKQRALTSAVPQKGSIIRQRSLPPFPENPFEVFDLGVFILTAASLSADIGP